MLEISERLTEHARMAIERLDLTGAFKADVPHEEIPVEPEPCSCEQALSLRARLSLAARGNVALHLFREDGLWHVESWRDGEMVSSYVGAPSVADALDRVGDWMRSATKG